MASVRYAEGQQRSGRLGATIYSHNRFGQYMRAGSVPVNPSTDRQVAARNRVQQLTIAWQNTLTQDQRDGWDLYGSNVPVNNRLGESVTLTGLNMFIRTNTLVLQAGGTRVDDAPVIFTLAIPEQALVMSASEATQQLTAAFDDTAEWCDEDGGYQVFYMGSPQNASLKFFGSPYRYLAQIDGDSVTPPSSPVAAMDTPDWPFAEEQRIWVKSRIIRADGRVSEFAQDNFLAGA